MNNTQSTSPYKRANFSPSRVSYISSFSHKKKTIHQHWHDPKSYVSKDMSEDDVVEVKRVFDDMCSTQCGYLIPNDLCVALKRFGFDANKEIIYDIMVEIDEIQKGGISFSEFISILQRRPAVKQRRQDVQWAFRKYDVKNKGYFDQDDFRRIVKELQQDISDQEVREIMEACSGNKSGRMTYEDFSKVMTSNMW